jgi:hypothetical protein
VPHRDVVDVLHLERDVVQPGLFVRETEEHVMVDIVVAAIESIEGADQV